MAGCGCSGCGCGSGGGSYEGGGGGEYSSFSIGESREKTRPMLKWDWVMLLGGLVALALAFSLSAGHLALAPLMLVALIILLGGGSLAFFLLIGLVIVIVSLATGRKLPSPRRS